MDQLIMFDSIAKWVDAFFVYVVTNNIAISIITTSLNVHTEF